MEFLAGIGRYFLPLIAFFILLNCSFSLLKKNKKTGALGYLVNSANGDKIPLNGFETSIGRSNSCDIVLAYNTISRFHAVLALYKNGWFVADTNSKTGTFVNSEKIQDRAQIENGDTIVFGNAVFKFINALVDEDSTVYTQPKQSSKLYESDEKFYTGDIWSQNEQPTSCSLVNKATGETFVLDDYQTCLIGRSNEAQIRIDFPSVSRCHALLSRQGEKWLVEDLDSTCGTFLNSKTLNQVTELIDGDILDIGGIMFVFKSDPY